MGWVTVYAALQEWVNDCQSMCLGILVALERRGIGIGHWRGDRHVVNAAMDTCRFTALWD